MKDFFGTVIEPGDAVLIARNAATAGQVGELVMFTVARNKTNDGLHVVDSTGARRGFSFDSSNTIAMKSVVKR